MPMEYGLGASLLGISYTFEQLIEDRQIGDDPMYLRIALLDQHGRILTDTQLEHSGSTTPINPEQLPSFAKMGAGITFIDQHSANEVIIAEPYVFKNQHVAQILVWISSKTVYDHFIKVPSGARRLFYIESADGRFHLPKGIQYRFLLEQLPEIGDLEFGGVRQLRLQGKYGEHEVLVNRIPIKETPFFLVSIVPAEEVYVRATTWLLPLAMVALSTLVLAGIAFAWRTDERNLFLRANLEVTAKSKQAVEERNRQLIREVAERKRAETALAESENRYRKFFEEDLSGAFMTAPDGRILACNPAFAKIFGFSSVEAALKASALDIFLHPNDREEFLSKIKQHKKLINYESEYRRLDGMTIQTIENVVGTFDENGELTEIKGFIVDNTERRMLEEQLRQSQKMEAIGTLAGGIAHDFNNILTAIIGNTEMALYKVPEQDSVRHNLEQVLKASNRARDLVKQILAFSRQSEQERKPLQISLIVKETLKLLRASLPTTIEIRQNIAAESATILADPTQIHQVLMNLCANASYAMRDKGGTLEISLREIDFNTCALVRDLDVQAGPCIELTVSDTGCGMDRITMDRIFDPFFTTKGPGEGTGMGLAMVHGTIKGHGGAITVESELGQGSRFHLFFPVVQSLRGEVEEKNSLPGGTYSEKILFVDDEEILLSTGQQMLEHLGYQVTTKRSSLEALKAFQLEPERFSLVITDQTMPKMTGAELARELLQIRPEIPIILCTGFSEMVDQERAKAIGIREFIMKPFVFSELAGIARKLLDGNA
jgi:two-component system, cell cycle sensor histidine kinase and response regulator CckA